MFASLQIYIFLLGEIEKSDKYVTQLRLCCAPLLADLFLYIYEAEFIQKLTFIFVLLALIRVYINLYFLLEI